MDNITSKLNGIIADINSWCECHGFAVESVYNTCHGTSLQEQLYYLFGVIKTVVESEKNLSDEISSLKSKFAELENFVDEYFKNLDLQDEVNKKIDELVSSGTIGEIIGEKLPEVLTLNTGNYCNSNLAKQIVYATAMSYYMNAWKTRNDTLSYGNYEESTDGNGTALDGEATSFTKMDCSTFVLLSLLGIPYSSSPYNGEKLDDRGNLGFCRQFIETVHNKNGKIRWAYEILQYAYLNKLLYTPKNSDDIQTGDVVFFCWDDEYVSEQTPDWWGHGTFEHCAHVGICVSNCQKFPSRVGLLHCVNTSALTDFQDLYEYSAKLKNQHMYTKIMRPKLSVDNVFLNGLWRFRGDVDKIPVVLNKSAINFSGGKMPSNMTKNKVDKVNGSLSQDNNRYTTPFIPYNVSMFVTNNASSCGYHICYYSLDEQYLSYSENKFVITEGAAYVRIEFYKKDGSELTGSDISAITNSTLTYHTWCDEEQSFICQKDANLKHLDTLFVFKETTKVESQIVLGKNK